MPHRLLLTTPLLLLAAACSSPTPRAPESQAPDGGPTPQTVVQIPTGSIVKVTRVERIGSADPDSEEAFDAYLREGLRRSPALDPAGGIETCESELVLSAAWDVASGQLSTTLRRGGGAPTPLYATRLTGRPLHEAMDALSRGTLASLGHPLPAGAPLGQLFTADADCARLTADGLDLLAQGDVGSARGRLQRALRIDPACTLTLLGAGTAELQRGNARKAEQLARDTLGNLGARCAPTTLHRLARLALLASAQQDPGRAASADTQLLALGEASRRERPHDPHGLYTLALARNFRREYESSVIDLRTLAARWPDVPLVAYHLSFAELATGNAEAALEAVQRASRGMSDEATLMPRAFALHTLERHGELDRYLERQERRARNDVRRHELLRMQSAHAILQGDREEALRLLLEDIEWLRRRPSQLERLALDLAEAGEVTIRLGGAEAMRSRILAIEENSPGTPTVTQALAYLTGLASLAREESLPESAIYTLQGHQQNVWASALRAEAHRRQGEIFDEVRELTAAATNTRDPLVRASLLRALRTAGRTDDAEALTEELRARMSRIDLRRPLEHPLLSPGRALAWLALTESR